MSRVGWLVPLALILTLGFGSHPTSAQPDAQQLISQVRIVHASPTVQAVDVLIDGVRSVPALGFGVATSYITLPAGAHEFAVVPVGTTVPVALFSLPMELAPGQAYTLLAVGAPAAPLVLQDERFVQPGGAPRVRFVHVVPEVPAVDFAVAGGPVLFRNVPAGQATPYLEVAPTTESLVVRLAGTETDVIQTPDVARAVATVYTFVAVGPAGGAGPAGLLVFIDS